MDGEYLRNPLNNNFSLTVPVNNECPGCEIYHVDLSEAAFLYLEPKGGVVGLAKSSYISYFWILIITLDATITYINCRG